MASSADGMRAAPTPCRDNDRMIGIRPEYGEILFKDGVAAPGEPAKGSGPSQRCPEGVPREFFRDLVKNVTKR
ncbi:hypothetical protein E4U35_005216 [Claviceps purpurea]|nr:hypothetical protein E4U37_006015 [Claviceps purpurea]KAG6202503.1 hypothetical protein E4U35_005216 [Claviceps purpurea]